MHSVIARTLVTAALVAGGVCLAHAGEKTVSCAGKLLKGVVHYSDNDIRFATSGGPVIFIDPMSGPADALVARLGQVRPDLILITHPHGDHFKPAVLKEYVKANPAVVLAGPADVVKAATEAGIAGMKTVAPGNNYALAGVSFEAVPAFFEEGEHHPRKAGWVGYVIQANGARYYVTGDTQPYVAMGEVKADAVFPLLSGCGGNMDQALTMAKLSGARVVVPVHTSDQVKVIQEFISKLPKDVVAGYFAQGEFVAGGGASAPASVAGVN